MTVNIDLNMGLIFYNKSVGHIHRCFNDVIKT